MSTRRFLSLLCAGLLLSGPVLAQSGRCIEEGRGERQTIVVLHDPVRLDVVRAGLAERQVGDLRILRPTFLRDATTQLVVGRLDATLLTTAAHFPTGGDEVRMSTLNFVFGEGDTQLSGAADQVVVSGSGFYPGTGSTISAGTALYRPVVGGSGRFAGATGQAKTEHLGDDSWRHTLELRLPPGRNAACR